jgi:hypothetical protein
VNLEVRAHRPPGITAFTDLLAALDGFPGLDGDRLVSEVGQKQKLMVRGLEYNVIAQHARLIELTRRRIFVSTFDFHDLAGRRGHDRSTETPILFK